MLVWKIYSLKMKYTWFHNSVALLKRAGIRNESGQVY